MSKPPQGEGQKAARQELITRDHSTQEKLRKKLDAKFPHQPVGGGQLPETLENLEFMLDSYGISVRYNVIAKELQTTIPGHAGTVDNIENTTLSRVISLCRLNNMPTGNVPGYLYAIGDRNPFNPAKDWITSKPWDGISRLPALYATVVQKDGFPEEFKRTLLLRWLLSAVAAVCKGRGFRARGVLTFQGAQGAGKTTWLRHLIDDEMLRDSVVKVDHHLDGGDKDSIISAVCHWLVELGELESSLRKDVARLKGFITADFDKVRRPYDRKESKYPRRTVFMATVNDRDFLVDPTGNSRFWVIPVVKLIWDHDIDMQQLFAEVHQLFLDGEQWWLTADEEAQLNELNRDHRGGSVVRDQVMDVIDETQLGQITNPYKTPTEVLIAAGIRNPTTPMAKECAGLLRELGIEPARVNGSMRYRVPLKEPEGLGQKPLKPAPPAAEIDDLKY